jgi:hypothetical protein
MGRFVADIERSVGGRRRYKEIRGIYWKILERDRGFEMRDTGWIRERYR